MRIGNMCLLPICSFSYMDGLVLERRKFTANALGLRLSCAILSIYAKGFVILQLLECIAVWMTSRCLSL